MSTSERIPTDEKEDIMKSNDVAGDQPEEQDDLRSKIFPQRLMEILADERNADAISWLPHGRAFIIRSREVFAEKVMPRFFSRKSKYSSFTRKLNRWNFVRISSGPDLGAYFHEFFLRDKPELAAQMFCKNARTNLAMTAAESHATSQEKSSSAMAPAPYPAMASAPVPQQELLPSMYALSLQKMAFKRQFEKEQVVKEQLANLQLFEKMRLFQQQPAFDCNSLLMSKSLLADSGPVRAQFALQHQQSAEAERLMQIHKAIAMARKVQLSDSRLPTINGAYAA